MTIDNDSNQQKLFKINEIGQNRHAERGASLISMSLFIMTLGFIISGFLVLQQKQVHLENMDITAERKTAIDDALNAFILSEGRLPCPASMIVDIDASEDVAAGTPAFGREMAGCDTGTYAMMTHGVATSTGVDGMRVQTGAIPVRTLNLPDEYIIDAEDKRFTYAVTGDFTVAGADFDTGLGDISLVDQNNNDIGASAGNIIYALIAQGRDTRGAFAFNGTEIDPCGSGAASGNCNWGADATFVDSLYKADDAGDNTFTQSVSFKSSQLAINWAVTPWSVCSSTCSTGIQTRTVTCEDSGGNVVPDSNCIGVKPPSSQPCTGTSTCVWVAGSFGSCSPVCGVPSSAFRSVECQDASGNVLAESNCTGTKPVTETACTFSPSANAGPNDATNPSEIQTRDCVWHESPWGACSETCSNIGAGQETRTVNCVRDDNGNSDGDSGETDVNDSLCTSSKPTETQSCTNGPYAWHESGFGQCSETCGGGTQTQTVTCQRPDGAVVADCFCSGTKPAETQACNTDSCASYEWETGACSVTCGEGTRPVTCIETGSNTTVADSFCSGAKPSNICTLAPCDAELSCTTTSSSDPRDIIFVVDNSGSIGSGRLDDDLKPFVKNLAQSIAFQPNEKVGLVSYGTTATTLLSPRSYEQTNFNNAVNSMTIDGRTNTTDALSLARSHLDGLSNTGRQQTVVLITDGKSNDTANTVQQATEIKSAGYRIIGVAVGFSEAEIAEATANAAAPANLNDITPEEQAIIDQIIEEAEQQFDEEQDEIDDNCNDDSSDEPDVRGVALCEEHARENADENYVDNIIRGFARAGLAHYTIFFVPDNQTDEVDEFAGITSGQEGQTLFGIASFAELQDSIAEISSTICEEAPPPTTTYTYSWETDPSFGACSATACGTSGNQTRAVWCERNDGTTVADSLCTGTKPAESQSCSAPACPLGSCNVGGTTYNDGDVIVGSETNTRCDNGEFTLTLDLCCNGSTFTHIEEQCGSYNSEPSCGSSAPTPVNGSCGSTHYNCTSGTAMNTQDHGGVYTWTCEGSHGGSNDDCNEAAACPGGSDSFCLAESDCGSGSSCQSGCCVSNSRSYAWITGSCSETCGGGTRPVTCQDDQGNTVSDSFCSGTKPATSCNTQACATSGPWTTGSCDATCGGGTRSVTCDYDSCTGTQPSTSCNTHACAVAATCGSAHGQTLSSAPSGSALCNAGDGLLNPPGVTGSGPWSWSCKGSNGGEAVSCNANKTASNSGCRLQHPALWTGSDRSQCIEFFRDRNSTAPIQTTQMSVGQSITVHSNHCGNGGCIGSTKIRCLANGDVEYYDEICNFQDNHF